MKLIIDASNIRSGGGVTHLIEVLNNTNKDTLKFDCIEVFSNTNTLSKINNQNWIVKKTHPWLQRGTLFISLWKKIHFEKYLKTAPTNTLLFNPAGTYTGTFKPHVEMSQNMLIWDNTESDRYGKTSIMKQKFRLLNMIQKKAFNSANGIIFISNYAKQTIQSYLNKSINNYPIIHHGVNQKFFKAPANQKPITEYTRDPFQIVYISPITFYKHQIQLVKAVKKLFKEGYNINLTLIGGEQKGYSDKFNQEIKSDKTYTKCVNYIGKVPYETVEEYYKNSNAFIFASTCENMPNILIEAMLSGLPILCSNYQPMPEFLGSDHPFYFDPTDTDSCYKNLKYFLENPEKRLDSALKANNSAKKYTWQDCSDQTFAYLYNTLKHKTIE